AGRRAARPARRAGAAGRDPPRRPRRRDRPRGRRPGDHPRDSGSPRARRARSGRTAGAGGLMTISDFAIKRRIVTVVVMLALVIFGIFSLISLEVDEFPDLTNPIVFVAVPYPGASPSQVEREVVEPMEEAFSALSGVDKITSKSLDGFAQIIVQFVFEKDPDQATQDVRDAISGIRNDLPVELEEPVLRRFDPADLQAAGVSISQVVQAVQAQNLAAPVGRI